MSGSLFGVSLLVGTEFSSKVLCWTRRITLDMAVTLMIYITKLNIRCSIGIVGLMVAVCHI